MRPPKDQGFTLLEMLAVMLIMVIGLSVMAASIRNGLANSQERSAGLNLELALRAARIDAILKGQTVFLKFDLNQNRYWQEGKTSHRLPSGMQVRLTTADLAPGQAAVAFYAGGGSSGGNIMLQKEGRAWRIDIAWLTGVSTLHELTVQ